ncbi:pyridoxal phosphate-dependent aminotransferase [Tropicimonas sp. IMCC34011]|uniref:pyridoxal phosphate-dependent aminotransferase n=1 Tax=Tropicimonas sp. IMCC34011 TaxID=2248759 RepID=UPI000E277E0E|nr:pyridoxal phosphate-dependent aminotransferase [Tropicimonas sp. IMCC34011]
MSDPRLTALARSLPETVPFVGAEVQERQRGRPFAARIGANESGFGPSPAAVKAMQDAATDVWMYGDSASWDLRSALSAKLGIDIEAIAIGAGIDGILNDLVRLFASDGSAVVTSDGAYPTFAYHVAAHGGRLETVPYRDDFEDPEALVAKAAERGARLVYLANPDNPMGTWHEPETIARMLDALPQDALLVLDEAYAEFAPGGRNLPLDTSDRRLIRLRTFSKAYGLAGLRVGYAIAPPDIIRAFDKVRDHFGIPRISQAAALAALGDEAHLARVIGQVEAARERIAEIAAKNGLLALPSATNFVAVDCKADGAFSRRLVQALAAQDVFVRMPFRAPQDRCIRVSTAPDEVLDIFADALPAALAEARKG